MGYFWVFWGILGNSQVGIIIVRFSSFIICEKKVAKNCCKKCCKNVVKNVAKFVVTNVVKLVIKKC